MIDAIVYGGHHIKGITARSVGSTLTGVHVQFEGRVNSDLAGISLKMDYLEALQLAQALVNAAYRHGEIAQRQAQNIVGKMEKRMKK